MSSKGWVLGNFGRIFNRPESDSNLRRSRRAERRMQPIELSNLPYKLFAGPYRLRDLQRDWLTLSGNRFLLVGFHHLLGNLADSLA